MSVNNFYTMPLWQPPFSAFKSIFEGIIFEDYEVWIQRPHNKNVRPRLSAGFIFCWSVYYWDKDKEYIVYIDRFQIKEINKEFFEELVTYVFNPSRITELSKMAGMCEMEYLEMI